jgi:SAM-dependent methyltransferase
MNIDRIISREPFRRYNNSLDFTPPKQEKGYYSPQGEQAQISVSGDYESYIREALIIRLQHQLSELSFRHNLTVVEIGGGEGRTIDRLGFSKDEFTYINIEPCVRAVRQGKNRFHFIASGSDIPLKSETADVVLSLASLDHVEDYLGCISEIFRVLRPKGTFFMTINNRDSWWKTLLRAFRLMEKRDMAIMRHHHFMWGVKDVKSILGKYFKNVTVETAIYTPDVLGWRLWELIFGSICRFFAPFSGSNIIVKAKK